MLLKALTLQTKASRWPILFRSHVIDQLQHVSLSVPLLVHNNKQKVYFDFSVSSTRILQAHFGSHLMNGETSSSVMLCFYQFVSIQNPCIHGYKLLLYLFNKALPSQSNLFVFWISSDSCINCSAIFDTFIKNASNAHKCATACLLTRQKTESFKTIDDDDDDLKTMRCGMWP